MPADNPGVECVGWWEQKDFGRQPMHDLFLEFESGQISGSGHDIIGPFTLCGTVNEQGRVAMLKYYIGQHTVDYVGEYDGEGMMWGEWHIGSWKDKWMIRIERAKAAAAKAGAIEEIV